MLPLLIAQTAEAVEEIREFSEIEINGAGWIMLLIGVVVLYGGVALCLFRAMGAKVHHFDESDETFEDDMTNLS